MYPTPIGNALELCQSLTAMVGERIERLLRVVVWVDGEKFEMGDNVVIQSHGAVAQRTLQVFADGHTPWSETLSSPQDYKIYGEWDDREREDLELVHQELVPFIPAHLYAVWEVGPKSTDGRCDILVGVILFEADFVRSIALNVYTDDVHVTTSSEFLEYLGHVILYAKALDIRRL